MPLAAVHSEYENLMLLFTILPSPSAAEREEEEETVRGGERERENCGEGMGRSQSGSLWSCCVVPVRACGGAAPPCLTAIHPLPRQRSEPAAACLQEVSSQLTHTFTPVFEMSPLPLHHLHRPAANDTAALNKRKCAWMLHKKQL